MKSKISEDIREVYSQSLTWAKLELEYIKLTAAEKLVVLASSLILGAVLAILLLPIMIMLLLALADVFKLIMAPALAYLSVAGIVILMILAIYLMRRPLVINPVAKFITRVMLDRSETKERDNKSKTD